MGPAANSGGDERYTLSLRIWHPYLDPAALTEQLDLTAERQWSAGSPRATSAGTPLSGVNDVTYWSAGLGSGSGEGLIEALNQANERFARKGPFLRSLRDDGGRAEYFVGWFAGTRTGFVLPMDLLDRTASLGVDLAFDVYGPDS